MPSHATSDAESGPHRAWSASDLDGDPHQADDKARRVRQMFAAIARSYDLNNRLHSFGRDQAWRRKAVHLCAVQPTDEVLDVACGTGDLAEAFCDARPRRVVGVDFTEPMLQIAREKAERRARHTGQRPPSYRAADAMDLPFDDGSFDIVSIAFGIRNVSDPAKALSEFHRVLRPGGRVIVLEFSEPTNPVLRGLNRLYTTRVMPITATLIARDRSGAYRYLPRSVETFLDRQSLQEALAEAGFERAQAHPLTFGVCVAHLAHTPATGR